MEGLYEEIFKMLNSSKYKSKLSSIFIDDNSIMFEDVVSELYIYCIDNNNYNITDEYILEFLKIFSKKSRKFKSSSIFDDYSFIKDTSLEDYGEDTDQMYIEKYSEIGLSDEEILCILYLQNNKNIKKYDYTFIARKDSNSNAIDKRKIYKYNQNIIKKLLKYITKEMWYHE